MSAQGGYGLLEYPEGKTNYGILNEDNEKTTITLNKWAADILQEALPNVHEAVKKLYDHACKKYPEISRRKKGVLVRKRLEKEVLKHQDIMKRLIGWNIQDFSDSLKY